MAAGARVREMGLVPTPRVVRVSVGVLVGLRALVNVRAPETRRMVEVREVVRG